MTNLSAKEIAARMGGRVERDSALVPGPGHSPADRSLSVKPDHDAPDRFIVHSFAGDDFAECRDHVRNKLGIVGNSRPISVPQGQRGRVVATYQYHNEAGDLLYEVLRYSPKDFKQRRPDGHGGWIWKLGDTQRVPYQLHELIAAVAAGRPIVIVEGEKDVDALRSAKIGIDATTFPAGAGKWPKNTRSTSRAPMSSSFPITTLLGVLTRATLPAVCPVSPNAFGSSTSQHVGPRVQKRVTSATGLRRGHSASARPVDRCSARVRTRGD